MCSHTRIVIGLACALLVAGCRTATRITEMPRVDLEFEGGNRGYLVGTPPEPGPMKTTRQMVQTDIEVPSFYRPKRTGAPVQLEEIAPPETEVGGAPPGGREPSASAHYDTYVAQNGDSLWSIATKPEVYGKATLWRRIFDANRELLKGNPDRLRAGMTLRIPRGEEASGGSTTYSDEGITYKK